MAKSVREQEIKVKVFDNSDKVRLHSSAVVDHEHGWYCT